MATFKTVIEKRWKRSDGTYNIRIRVTHNRKVKLISTQYYATTDDLTRSFNLKNDFFIDATNDLIKKYRDACNRFEGDLSSMTVSQVVDLVVNDYQNKSDMFQLDFIKYGRDYVNCLTKKEHKGTARTYNVALNSLVKFIGKDKLNINDITVDFLEKYCNWIQNSPARDNRVKGDRAASLYLSNIRALHNKAKLEFNNEDLGVIKIPLSPFARFKLPRVTSSRKRALSIEKIQAIIDLEYRTNNNINKGEFNRYNLAKDMFLLSFALVGMNSADLYNCKLFKDDLLTYNRTKTMNRRSDRAEISIVIESGIKPLFDKYRDSTGIRVFNFYQHYSNADTFNAAINKLLKSIGDDIGVDDLEFYAARHSWATIATNIAKVDKYTVHTALNHVDDAMKVTDIYIDKDYSIIADANKKVLALFNLDKIK